MKNNLMQTIQQPPHMGTIESLTDLAVKVFGDEQRASIFLSRPNLVLSGERPLAIMQEPNGPARVEEVLRQIEYGFCS